MKSASQLTPLVTSPDTSHMEKASLPRPTAMASSSRRPEHLLGNNVVLPSALPFRQPAPGFILLLSTPPSTSPGFQYGLPSPPAEFETSLRYGSAAADQPQRRCQSARTSFSTQDQFAFCSTIPASAWEEVNILLLTYAVYC